MVHTSRFLIPRMKNFSGCASRIRDAVKLREEAQDVSPAGHRMHTKRGRGAFGLFLSFTR